MINYLKEKLSFPILKVIYFSDGCAEQYKNRINFINFTHHKQDFDIPAEKHFFATSHGKGPYDGIGGTIKRETAYHSIKQAYDSQILTARDLFLFAKEKLKNIKVIFVSKDQVAMKSESLKERFEKSKIIAGIRKFHSFIPMLTSNKTLNVKKYSFSANAIEKNMF